MEDISMIPAGTIKFKACPRCKGDVLLDKDRYGYYLECIQCAHMIDLPQLRVSKVGVA
jgi:hypothetical protein